MGRLGYSKHRIPSLGLERVSRAFPGVETNATGGFGNWTAGLGRTSTTPCLAYDVPLGSASVQCLPSLWSGLDETAVGPVPFGLIDEPGEFALAWSDYLDYPTSNSWSSSHLIRVGRRSAFVPFAPLALRYCNAMASASTPSSLACATSSVTLGTSGRPVSVAWDGFQFDKSIVAWRQQTRQVGTDRTLMLSVGSIPGSQTLPTPQTLVSSVTGGTLRVNSGPGVACGGYFSAGSYDCIVAYVDFADELNRVRTTRFYTSWHGTSTGGGPAEFLIVPENSPYLVDSSNARTAGDLSVWYNGGKYWLAFRDSSIGQRIRYYTSTDGAAWSQVALLGSTTATGSVLPHAASISYWGNPDINSSNSTIHFLTVIP